MVGTGVIKLSEVQTEVWGNVLAGRTLKGAFAAADGTFNSTYVGVKDRLSNFQGYNHNLLPLVYDYDGNSYQPVRIGTQIWLSSNFRCTMLNNGIAMGWAGDGSTALPTQWNNHSYPSYVNYYIDTYYNASAMSNVNFPIVGYHVPSFSELNTLASTLGGANIAGGKMKLTGMTYWPTPNTGADNSSGFNGRPTGYLGYNAQYSGTTNMYFWINEQHDTGGGIYAWYWGALSYNSAALGYFDYSVTSYGSAPVRLIKD